LIRDDLETIAGDLADQGDALARAAELVGDGSGPEEIAAALIQLSLARRMMERALEQSGALLDRLAVAASEVT